MNTETQNYKIIVAYDGTRYKGWQVQKSTDDTIQGKLQHVLSTLAGKPVEVIGSGRTDAGVHAVGQVASFHMPKHFSKDEIFIWLNEHLPADIAVTDISNVPDRFHARYNAVSKHMCIQYTPVLCQMCSGENMYTTMISRLTQTG